MKFLRLSNYQRQTGFTIVELLVVIVVIGILAAITIVSYTGITNKATLTSLTSDLDNASKQLKIFQTINGNYPATISLDCASTPDTTLNKCLKLSPGNTITSLTDDYSVNNSTSPQTFSLTIKNSNSNIISVITESSKPTVLVPAPLNPVADWIATPIDNGITGDHYGNFYDTVSKTYASVTRAGIKTIYDPATQHIYDVPPNKLAINPRSDGKNGSEAVIEEGRTNYLVNSYGASNDGTRWTTGWNLYNTTATPPTYSLIVGPYGGTAQRIQYSGLAGDTGTTLQSLLQGTSKGSFSAGDSATVTAYVKGQLTGLTAHISVYAYDINNIQVGSGAFSSNFSSSNNWIPLSVNYPDLPANASYLVLYFYISGISIGKSVDLSVGSIQLEKGTFATSYIPTTTTSVTRNADLVTVPTTNWSVGAGSMVAVANYPLAPGNSALYRWADVASNNWLDAYVNGSSGLLYMFMMANGVQYTPYLPGMTAGQYFTGAYTYATGSTNSTYLNGGSRAQSSTQASDLLNMTSTANIGSYFNNSIVYNGSIQRLTVYSSALSSLDVSTVTGAVQNGP